MLRLLAGRSSIKGRSRRQQAAGGLPAWDVLRLRMMADKKPCREMTHCRLNAAMDDFNTTARVGFLLFILLSHGRAWTKTNVRDISSQLTSALSSPRRVPLLFAQNTVSEG